jgi:hypothetical protein
MQQRIAEKEKEAKEEQLRQMAQRAREERAGIAAPSTGAARVAADGGGGAMAAALADYGSASESEAEEEAAESEDEEAAREREEQRREKRKERERELRMSNMGTEQRARVLARFVSVVFFFNGELELTTVNIQCTKPRHFGKDCPRSCQADDVQGVYARLAIVQPGAIVWLVC